MIDLSLARRVLNKAGKELSKTLADTVISPDAAVLIQKALDDVTFMFDILHLDEIDAIDIRKDQTNNKGGQNNGNCE